MKNSRIPKRIFGFMAMLMVLTSATLALACPVHRVKAGSAKVDTRLERHFDYDHDGHIGPGERWAMLKARVNHFSEYRCDYNRNGWVDTRSERACL